MGKPLASQGMDTTSPSHAVRLDGICVKCGNAETDGRIKIDPDRIQVIDAIKSIKIDLTVNGESGTGDAGAGVAVRSAGIDARIVRGHMLQT